MCEIEELRSPITASTIQEISAFLASFVRAGELAKPLPGDDDEHCWARRLNSWWVLNPYCRNDSPIAVILREGGGRVVGFAGFIPHDYELDGKVVPALISTTFFVSEEYRGKAMSMILRAERYARDHHIIDASPSDKMQRILDRLRYERFSVETRYIYIVRRDGITPTALLSRVGSALCRQGSRSAFRHSARFIHRPEEILAVPPRRDGELRRRVTREGLSWFMSCGTERKRLVAICNAEGSLLAYGIGVMQRVRGLKVLRILDYASFDESFGLDGLFSYAATHPEAFDLSGEMDLVSWPILDDHSPDRAFLRVQRPANLYYKVPGTWQYSRKVGLPGEGDIPLL